MFDTLRPSGFSRRQLKTRTIVNHTYQEREVRHYKLVPERRPHPCRLRYRTAHPCYYHAHYTHWGPRGRRVLVLKEAWVVKIERRSPRAMRSLGETRD